MDCPRDPERKVVRNEEPRPVHERVREKRKVGATRSGGALAEGWNDARRGNVTDDRQEQDVPGDPMHAGASTAAGTPTTVPVDEIVDRAAYVDGGGNAHEEHFDENVRAIERS